MDKFERRGFLKQVAFGTAAIPTAFLGAAPAKAPTVQRAAQAGRPELRNPWLATEFVHGRVLSKSGATVVVDTDEGLKGLLISSSSDIWKGGLAALDSVEPGDFFYARGVKMDDGAIAVLKIWVNLVNLVGRVEDPTPTQLRLRITQSGIDVIGALKPIVRLSPLTLVNNVAGRVQDIRRDRLVQVIGAAVGDTAINAARVWTY